MGGSVYLPTLTFAWSSATTAGRSASTTDGNPAVRYAFSATLLCLVLAFPLAYVIAFKADRFKISFSGWSFCRSS